MQTQLQEQWLHDTRSFWDVESVFEAKYRRICSDPEIEATTDERVLEPLWRKRTEDEFAWLFDGSHLEPDWTCLEIGCGIGRLLKPVARCCRRVIGVDISEQMVAHSRDYLSGVANAEVHLNDGRTLCVIPDDSVDLVYSHLAFQHMTTQEVVDGYLAEIVRILRPGGYCRIQCWREAPLPLAQRLKNIARILVGGKRYHGSRCWTWAPGKKVRFGGVTFHPRPWRRRLERHGLRVIAMQLGLGHDYWMWTTIRKP